MKLRQLLTIPPRMLWFGYLANRHANKAKKYGLDFPNLLRYHRDLSYYYFYKAFGHKPNEKE